MAARSVGPMMSEREIYELAAAMFVGGAIIGALLVAIALASGWIA